MGKSVWAKIQRAILINIVLAASIIIGTLLWDVTVGDGELPGFTPLLLSEREAARAHTQEVFDLKGLQSSEFYWEKLRPTIEIVRKINPEAANWVCNRFEEGKIEFHYQVDGDCIAKYDFIEKNLKISHYLFALNDGRKAAVFCHEYRHSRQNIGKVTRLILSMALSSGDVSIIENDAYLYEHEALAAIFGDNHN